MIMLDLRSLILRDFSIWGRTGTSMEFARVITSGIKARAARSRFFPDSIFILLKIGSCLLSLFLRHSITGPAIFY